MGCVISCVVGGSVVWFILFVVNICVSVVYWLGSLLFSFVVSSFFSSVFISVFISLVVVSFTGFSNVIVVSVVLLSCFSSLFPHEDNDKDIVPANNAAFILFK